MTLEGATKNEGGIRRNSRNNRRQGGLGHVAKVKVVVISRLELSKTKGLQAPLRGDLDPLDEVKDGGYIVEIDTNNRREDNLGF
jgi:hypothetical protein